MGHRKAAIWEGRLGLESVILFLVVSIFVGAAAPAAVMFLGDWSDFGTQFQLAGPKTRSMDGSPVEWVAGECRGPACRT